MQQDSSTYYSEEDLDLTKREEQKKSGRQRVEYFAEEKFDKVDLRRSVHLGWGAFLGAGFIAFCMAASAMTQGQSWNVSFRWLQRRVGAQFGTMTYIITSNAMYYWDGDKWVVRDWAKLDVPKFKSWFTAAARPPPTPSELPTTRHQGLQPADMQHHLASRRPNSETEHGSNSLLLGFAASGCSPH